MLQIRSSVQQVLEGLRYLHQKDIAHLDIKVSICPTTSTVSDLYELLWVPNVVVFVHIPSSQKIFWWQVQGVIRSAFATSGMPLNWRLQRSTTANTARQNMSLQRLLTKLQFPQQQTYGQPPVLWHGEVTRHSRHYIHTQLSASPSNFCVYLCFYVALQIPSHVSVLFSHRPVGVITYLWYLFFFFPQHACI